MKLNITCTHEELIPTRAHPHDAGLDLRSATKGTVTLQPGERMLIPTGVHAAIPAGYVGLCAPRSGLAADWGITLANAPGVIDSGYTGEILVNLINHGEYPAAIDYGDRIAQLLIMPIVLPEVQQVTHLSTTARGARGHGSTGTK